VSLIHSFPQTWSKEEEEEEEEDNEEEEEEDTSAEQSLDESSEKPMEESQSAVSLQSLTFVTTSCSRQNKTPDLSRSPRS